MALFSKYKKRNKYWIGRWAFVFLGFLLLILLSFLNLLFLDNSYMEEEKEELFYFGKQIEWAIVPLIQNDDIATLKKYCVDFKDDDFRFRIFDKNKKLTASSKPEETESMLDPKSDIFKKTYGIFEVYRRSIKDKKIGLIKELNTNKGVYYIEITMSKDDVLKHVVTAQRVIYFLFGLFLIFIIWSYCYITRRIRIPFDYLEESITKIANGELDTPIDIQKHEILNELSIAIKKMTTQLKSQIKRLKQLEEYKTEFIQNVSHEVKTPITAINMAIELIENNNDKNLTPETKECFNIISYQTKYLNTLVNDILSISRLEDDKIRENKNFSYFVVNNTIRNLIEYTSLNGIKLEYIQNDTINLFGDEDLISTLVSNILINAIKYSKTEKIVITVSKRDEDCVLEIRDFGIGIPKEHQDKIFEKFYRVDKSRSRNNGGTGLGLAIAKNIVELHNGKITLESEFNKGCNFIITIPVR